MTAPCKDCPDRELTCHTSCEKYKAFTEYCDERRSERRKAVAVRYFSAETIRVTRRRAYRENHQ